MDAQLALGKPRSAKELSPSGGSFFDHGRAADGFGRAGWRGRNGGLIVFGGGPDETPRLALQGIGGLLEIETDGRKLLTSSGDGLAEPLGSAPEIFQSDLEVAVVREGSGKLLRILKGPNQGALGSGDRRQSIERLPQTSIRTSNDLEIFQDALNRPIRTGQLMEIRPRLPKLSQSDGQIGTRGG